MAKTKAPPAKKMVVKKKKAVKSNSDGLDYFGQAHAKMLMDPCNSLIEESVYPGDRGYVNRFVANASYGNGASATSFMAFIKPGNQVSTNFDLATSATTAALSYQKASYPGATFLTNNASKARAISFCINLRPNASANNCTGTIHFGIVNAQTFANAVVTSPDIVLQYLTDSVSCAQALLSPLEIRWSPGGFDDRYCSTSVLADDDSDRNVLVVVGIGLPVASGVQYRMTAITEWSPAGLNGITNDATSVGRSKNTIAQVTRVLKMKDNSWWWNLGQRSAKFASSVIGGYAAGGPIGALGSAVSFF